MSRPLRDGEHNKGTPARAGATPQADVDWAVGAYQRWRTMSGGSDAVRQAEALLELDGLMAHLAGHSVIYGPVMTSRPRCANQEQQTCVLDDCPRGGTSGAAHGAHGGTTRH